MPFSRSRSPESIARSSTCWCSPKAPDCQSMASTRVVLPWSTWATMATLRMSSRVFMGMMPIVSGFGGARDHRRGRSRRCGGAGRSGTLGGRHGVRRWAGRPGSHADGEGVGQVQPAQLVVVLERLRAAVGDLAPATRASGTRSPSGQAPPDRARAPPGPSSHPHAELLADLAVQRADSGDSPGLDLAAGQLPAAGQGRAARCAGPPAAGSGRVEVVDDRRADHEAGRERQVGEDCRPWDRRTVCH